MIEKDRLKAYGWKITLVFCFAIAMAYLEAAVVVYLRELIYPGGFDLPLKALSPTLLNIELFRELATVVMITAIAGIAGRKIWEQFGYFIIVFGVWDIFYYVWLKVLIGWPATLTEWDILFLIPLPWIGPVIAPVAVAALMTVGGIMITRLYVMGYTFKLTVISWILWILATAVILFSFMYDTDATISLQPPKPYLYSLLFIGLILYVAGYVISHRAVRRAGSL